VAAVLGGLEVRRLVCARITGEKIVRAIKHAMIRFKVSLLLVAFFSVKLFFGLAWRQAGAQLFAG
jgi:hypothetical protein